MRYFGKKNLVCSPNHSEWSILSKVRRRPLRRSSAGSLACLRWLILQDATGSEDAPPHAGGAVDRRRFGRGRSLGGYTLLNFIPIIQHFTLRLKCQIHPSELPPREGSSEVEKIFFKK